MDPLFLRVKDKLLKFVNVLLRFWKINNQCQSPNKAEKVLRWLSFKILACLTVKCRPNKNFVERQNSRSWIVWWGSLSLKTFWLLWRCGSYDVSVLMTFWFLWRFGSYDVLVLMTFWFLWRFVSYDVLVLRTFWFLWRFDPYDVLVLITFWFLWHFDSYDVLVPMTF
jgi:hypothetical protein